MLPDLPEPKCFTLDPVTRTFRNGGVSLRPLPTGGHHTLGVPVGGVRFVSFYSARELIRHLPERVQGAEVESESLGERLISGLDATGHRTTLTFPSGTFNNHAPLQLVDEEWISMELGLVVHGHYTDSRSGDIEYRLSNIRRGDPPSHLFVVPADYTMRDVKTANDADDPWLSFSGPARYAADLRAK